MPITNGKYVNPEWVNGTSPAIDEDEMNAISDTLQQVPIANGGTGGTTIAEARNNLGLGNTSGALPLANGGTGAATAAAARANLGITPANIGALSINGGTINGNLTINGSLDATAFDSGMILPIANGGTGAGTVAAARNNLGLGNTSGALPIANGGTGATTAANAVNNLGIMDYVIEYGESATEGLDTSKFQADAYTHIFWQKWFFGKLEIWGTAHSLVNADILTKSPWGGYESAYMTLWGTWPVKFNNRPVVNFELVGADSDYYMGDYMIIWNGPTGTTNVSKQSPFFKLWRGVAKTIGHPQFSFRAVGQWK